MRFPKPEKRTSGPKCESLAATYHDDVIDKVVASADDAVAGVRDGDVVLIGGFGNVGVPVQLIEALVRLGRRDLTVVSNNCGTGEAPGRRCGPTSGSQQTPSAVSREPEPGPRSSWS